MKPKILIAGAIIAAIAICILATGMTATALHPASAKPVKTHQACTVAGAVTDDYAHALGGVAVTLHVMGYDKKSGEARELYEMNTTTANDTPFQGSFVFDNVVIEHDTAYAYLTACAKIPFGPAAGMPIVGQSYNFTLEKNKVADMDIIICMPQFPPPLLDGTN